MTYAHLIDGLDDEGRGVIDRALEGPKGDQKSKAARERAVLAALTNVPGVAR